FEEYPETASDETQSCCGVKFCQFISPELKNTSHSVVNFDDELFKKTFEANELSVDNVTLNEFVAAHKIACEYYDKLTQIRCNGKSILAKFYQRKDNTSLLHYFIGCQNYKHGEKGHRFLSLSQ
ncbi:5332_t:CDS:2, partial [Cetraspora pellucida]